MKTLILTAGLASALLVGSQFLIANSQDAGMPEMPGMPQPEWQHELLARGVGEWDAVLTFQMPVGEEMVEQTMRGTESVTMFGPFYQVADFSGSFMGVPFEGRATMSYDPVREEWVGTWIDSMAPSMQVMRGSFDEATRSVTLFYDGVNEMSQLQPGKIVITFTSDDAHTFDSYWLDDEGNATRNMHIDYTRAKADGGDMR